MSSWARAPPPPRVWKMMSNDVVVGFQGNGLVGLDGSHLGLEDDEQWCCSWLPRQWSSRPGWVPPGWGKALTPAPSPPPPVHLEALGDHNSRHAPLFKLGSWVHQIPWCWLGVVDTNALVDLVRGYVLEEFLCFEHKLWHLVGMEELHMFV